MPTEKQTEANRRNALKSTGPRTDEGKNKSRLNSFKHGLTGHLDVLTPDERAARDTFIAGIIGTLKPADPLETQLAHSVADGYWRINRVSAIEDDLLADEGFADHPQHFQLLGTYEMRLHRKVTADLRQLRQIQAPRLAAEAAQAEQEKAAREKALDESCALFELSLRRGTQPDLTGEFTHPDGFVYSIPRLLQTMTDNRRLKSARQNLSNNSFRIDELERFLPAPPPPSAPPAQ